MLESKNTAMSKAAFDSAISAISDRCVFTDDQIKVLTDMIECLRAAAEYDKRRR